MSFLVSGLHNGGFLSFQRVFSPAAVWHIFVRKLRFFFVSDFTFSLSLCRKSLGVVFISFGFSSISGSGSYLSFASAQLVSYQGFSQQVYKAGIHCLIKCRLKRLATNALSIRQLVACQLQLELAKVEEVNSFKGVKPMHLFGHALLVWLYLLRLMVRYLLLSASGECRLVLGRQLIEGTRM